MSQPPASDASDDPFAAFGGDRTVIKPSAGRAASPSAGAAGSGGAPGGGIGGGAGGGVGGGLGGSAGPGREAPLAIDALMSASLNPLVSAAMPLLTAAPRIRHTAQHPNPAGLKDALSEGIRKFEAHARAQGVPNEQVIAGRYILCTLLDESAASTPWDGSGVWSAQSLLVQFHNETWGGEKVFQLMAKLAENVPTNRHLLELMYVVLAFGFEGRYRVIDNGRTQLDSVRSRLAQMLQQGSHPDPALSPRWEGVKAEAGGLRAGVPVWVAACVAGVLLLGAYLGLRFSINAASDPVFAQLRSFDVKTAVAVTPPPPPAPAAPPPPRLATFLKADIDAGLVQVRDGADRSVVIIKGDGFFEPGSAQVAAQVMPLLGRIADALQAVKGPVLVTGHTDNQPIRSLRFPSNWHLSQERAASVRAILAERVEPSRLRAEGRADAEAVDDNSTPAGRARNRRVEVTLFVQAAG